MKLINGFSKLDKIEKIQNIVNQLSDGENISPILKKFELIDLSLQSVLEEISENVISNYHLPYSIAPNFLINNSIYHIPMVIEESSVVAAASSAAKFWSTKGGFNANVISQQKVGQIHFTWAGQFDQLEAQKSNLFESMKQCVKPFTRGMEKRGGGFSKIELINLIDKIDNYYQIRAYFETADAMGANFINTCLEAMSQNLIEFCNNNFTDSGKDCQVIMSILSNHTPQCIVECSVECNIKDLKEISGTFLPEEFARKFELAAQIAEIDIYRATTHNKGIYNGIDAVAIATGNDFRAIEASGHSFAAVSGTYKSLTKAEITQSNFKYTLRIPLAVGTVGGLTKIHPLAALSLKILNFPSSAELMAIMASAGLANNFSAVKSLITSGIQKGHMKLHLNNILNAFNASKQEKTMAIEHFQNKTVNYSTVSEYLSGLRK